MKILMFLSIISFYSFAAEQLLIPKLIKGTIVHHSNSESDFKIDVTSPGECTTKQELTTCTKIEAVASIGNKTFSINELRIWNAASTNHNYVDYKYAVSYYFYADLPYSKGELKTPVRIAVLSSLGGKVGNVHLKFSEFNLKEEILFKEIQYH